MIIAKVYLNTMIHRRSFFIAGTAALDCRPTAAFGQGQTPMTHIVLLGDSIFDNAAYVAGGALWCAKFAISYLPAVARP